MKVINKSYMPSGGFKSKTKYYVSFLNSQGRGLKWTFVTDDVEPSKEPSSDDEGWNCSQCTYLNKPGVANCSMCDYPMMKSISQYIQNMDLDQLSEKDCKQALKKIKTILKANKD